MENSGDAQKRVEQIASKLRTYDNQGVKFAEAKARLSAEGFTSNEIVQASYSVPYDGKPNLPRKIDPATKYYSQHGAEAERVGEGILKAQQKDRQDIATLDGLAAGSAPDLQSEVFYQNKYLNDIGMSWWLWLLIEGGLSFAIYKFNLPYVCYAIIIISLIIYLAKKRS